MAAVTSRRASATSKSTGNRPSSASLVVAVVGDGGVGKTCMLLSYLSGKFFSDVLPGPMDWHSEFDHLTRHPVILQQDGVEVSMTLIDTTGLDEYQKMREILCAKADVYLVCFDVTNPASLERVTHHWLPEIRTYNPYAPFLLVANKCDERIKAQIEGKPSSAFVSFSHAKTIGQDLGAAGYYECSARNLTGLKKVFEEAVVTGLQSKLPGDGDKRNSCRIS